MSNDTYIVAVSSSGTGTVDMIKINDNDQVQLGTDLYFDYLVHRTQTPPGSPGTSSIYVYMTQTGTSPTKTIEYKLKNSNGDQIIIASFME